MDLKNAYDKSTQKGNMRSTESTWSGRKVEDCENTLMKIELMSNQNK